LDVENNGRDYAVHMVPISDKTGQFWRFIPLGNNVYRLQTKFLKNAYSLDIVNDKNSGNDKMPHMANTGDYSGQRWHLLRQSDGTYRLFNDFTGNRRFLDVRAKSSRLRMNIDRDGEVDAGQHWTLSEI
jgi:immune inhibitor A